MAPRQANQSDFSIEQLYCRDHVAQRVQLQQEIVTEAQEHLEQAWINLANVKKLIDIAAMLQSEAGLNGDVASRAETSNLSGQVDSLAKATADTVARAEANLQRANAILSRYNELASMA